VFWPMEAIGFVRRSTFPQLMVAGGCAAFCFVFAALAAYGKPGLGIGQGFYLAIALVALSAGPGTGAAAGLTATFLYVVALSIGSRAAFDGAFSLPVAIRLASYVAVGVTIGYVARSGRRMLARSLRVLDELLLLAGREVEGGALSSSGFEAAVQRGVAAGWPFALLIGEVRPLGSGGSLGLEDDGSIEALRVARLCLPADCALARTGHSRIAILISEERAAGSRELCVHLQDELNERGWATNFALAAYPEDGTEMMTLLQTAIERLHASRASRGSIAGARLPI